MKVSNTFSAKVVIDIANNKMVEKTKDAINEISIDKLMNKFSDSLTVNVKGVTVNQFKQILAILSSENEEYAISLKQEDETESLLVDIDEE